MVKKRADEASRSKAAANAVKTRVRKTTKKQQKQLAKKDVRVHGKIPNSFRLVAQVYKIFRDNWRKLLGIVIIYLVLNIVFASGLGTIGNSITNIKNNLQNSGGRHLSDALGGFGSLVGSAGSNTSQTGAVLQTILIVIESLVVIWALRQILAGKSIRVKDAYYRSMMPLIPFLLVIGVLIIQLLPVLLGSALASAILSAIFNSSGTLTAVFIVVFVLLASWSIYMLSSSIFALYIVTLPDMQPLKALRAAKKLVQYRRWQVLRRVLFLPVFLVLALGIIIMPLILWATFLAAPIFYILGMFAILFIHSYLYSLYRSLLE